MKCFRGRFIYIKSVASEVAIYTEVCVLYFLYFTKINYFKSYKKCFLFHLKSSFCSQGIQFFVIFSLFSRLKGSNETAIIMAL